MDCPCCGQPYPADSGDLVFLDEYRVVGKGSETVRLTTTQYKIISAVRRRTLSLEEIINTVYGDRPDGGPLSARNTISVHMVRLNERLAPLGISVRAVRLGGWSPPYKIENVAR